MAEHEKAEAPKASEHVNEHGVDPQSTANVVNPGEATAVTDENLEQVAHAREVLKKEAESSDVTDGPADNFTGDASDDAADHIFSNDPYKKAFPPGPDDPSKL
jgi:hypothetical protein